MSQPPRTFGGQRPRRRQGGENGAGQKNKTSRAVDGPATASQPEGERPGAEAADVGGDIEQGVEVERLAFGVASALLQNFWQPGTQQLPGGVDAGDHHDQGQKPPGEEDLPKAG